MLNEFTRRYLLDGLRASPQVLEHLMNDADPSIWDRRPVPGRFTIREVCAHVADWDGVWQQRLDVMLAGDTGNAAIPDHDPGQRAREHDYASADPATSLQQFKSQRAALVDRLQDLALDDWQRVGHHEVRGPFTVADLAVTALGHDHYHLAQVTEWIQMQSST
ncbi:MAG: DinB family protein [Candidatus Bipolaricaulia bacterium]